jgi:hypothetical protein
MSFDLKKIKPTKNDNPPRIVVYGPGGVGKSTFAASAPDVLFFDIENGLDGIESSKIPIKNWHDVLEAITALHDQEHDFKTIAVDSIDWMEGIIHTMVAKSEGKNNIEEIGYGKGYKMALDYWQQFLQGMTSLRDNKNMTIILIAHDQIKRFDDPTGQGYDRHMLKLHQVAGAMVFEWADAVLFAKQKTYVSKEDVGFNQKKSKAKSLGRILYTEDNPAYMAKHRASLSLPPEISFSWDNFISSIGQKETQKGE